MDNGWISIHRKIVNNPYYFSEPFTKMQAWFDMLIIANHKPGCFFKRGIKVDVERGQIGYDLESLAKRWMWSRGKVERYLNALENENQIVRQKTNVTTLISIVNYDTYQRSNKPNDNANDNANGHQTVKQTVKQTDTNNNDNKDNNVNNIDSEIKDFLSQSPKKTLDEKVDNRKIREEKFKESLFAYTRYSENPNGLYSKEMVKEFFLYWSEPTKNQISMKWEKEKTWDTARRLARWAKNEDSFSKSKDPGSSPKLSTDVYLQSRNERRIRQAN